MADGSFPTLISRDRNTNAQANTVWVRISDDTNALALDGSGFITANINGTVTVSAIDLDIRNLSESTDQVLVFANTVKDGSGTDLVPLVDADGNLQVDVLSGGGGTEYTEDAVAAANATGLANLAERDDVLSAITPIEGDWSKLYVSANGALWVSVDGTVAATQSGTWNIGTVASITADVNIADGGNTITVDATSLDIRTITKATDSIQISKDTSANSESNPIYVYNTASVVSGTEVHDYDTVAAVVSDATSNHDYTVTGTTMFLKSVIVAGSGSVKFEIQYGPVASLATVAVGFLNGRQGDTKQVIFNPPLEVPATSTGTVRVIRTNRQGAATDLYSTIIGNDV